MDLLGVLSNSNYCILAITGVSPIPVLLEDGLSDFSLSTLDSDELSSD